MGDAFSITDPLPARKEKIVNLLRILRFFPMRQGNNVLQYPLHIKEPLPFPPGKDRQRETVLRVISMKKMLFIMNPYAGMRKANRVLDQILEIFSRAEYAVTVCMTGGPGDGTRIARELGGGMDLVVCCGGDGTFNETVSGLMGIPVPIGYIPAGSTNDFASSLKLPLDPVKAARLCVTGRPVRLDVGMFGERPFSYVASFGAFTRTSYATPQNVKNALGHTAYVLGGIQELNQIKDIHARFELDDGQVVEDNFLFGAISNSTSVGGILTLDPGAVDLGDGRLELLLVRAPREIGELGECLMAIQKKEYNCSMITFLSTRSVKVYTEEKLDWTLDGELESGRDAVEVRCIRHAIELIGEEADGLA